MSDGPAIIVDSVSKMYHKRAGMGTLLSMIPGFRPSGSDEFWALKDVSFEVKPGECVGIIGPNGAGKSTILKILSRVTSPTSGTYHVSGRLSSLIEVGAGFHPELTGRENVYLNAAILGMSKKEIETKFDEIVEFAELGEFIDVPVKRYSSGMRVRLGFAVAAHLEPEVLLIDEVLAVGDAAFRKKCLGRTGDVVREGRAVVFVSHNMAAVESLCERVVLIDRGRVTACGAPREVIGRYLQRTSTKRAARVDLSTHPGRGAQYKPVIRGVRLLGLGGEERCQFRMGEAIQFELDLDSGSRRLTAPVVRISVSDGLGQRLCNLFTDQTLPAPIELSGRDTLQCRWQDCRLVPGSYTIKLAVANGSSVLEHIDVIEGAVSFEVLPAPLYGTFNVPSGPRSGVFLPHVSWSVNGKALA